MLDRIGATQALSETVASAQLEANGSCSHGGILDALILSREARGLMDARSIRERKHPDAGAAKLPQHPAAG